MVAVFGVFIALSMLMFKQFGVVAAAILIDATIVRGVLLPTMKLLGEWNWYVPGWLSGCPGSRLPSLRPETLPEPVSA